MLDQPEPDHLGGARSFGPKTIRLMRRAYKEAWDEVKGRYPQQNPSNIRFLIASFILGAVRLGSRDPKALKDRALTGLDEVEGKNRL